MDVKRKILIFLFLLFTFLLGIYIYREYQRHLMIEKREKETHILSDIKSSYHSYVKVRKKAALYQKDGKNYKKIGIVQKNEEFTLEEIKNFSLQEKYFKIKGMDYYIFYKDVIKIEKLSEQNQDYKNYIPFQESIVTKKTRLYQNDELIYDLDISLTFPILIKEDGKKYIIFNEKLFYIKDEDIKNTIQNDIKQENIASEMSVLNYHFFYEDGHNNCNQIICVSRSAFETQMKYLSDNDYYTVTMKEFEQFLDKKIQLPIKSVLLTVDDGALGSDTVLPQVLEKYDKRASLFLITSFFDYKKFTSPRVELHSHSNNMHNQGVCKGGQGGGIKCLKEEDVLADLKITRDLLHNTTAFAYPFYEYNDRAINLLKKAGFTVAFIGGNKKAIPGMNKMLIPRYAVVADTSLNDFIRKIT